MTLILLCVESVGFTQTHLHLCSQKVPAARLNTLLGLPAKDFMNVSSNGYYTKCKWCIVPSNIESRVTWTKIRFDDETKSTDC